MRVNFGCGLNKLAGFVNLDKEPACAPDLVWDIEKTPWPFPDNSIVEAKFIHSLEHVGADVDTFLAIIRELHRVCRDGARIGIRVPHPRSDAFLGDPTHVRPITPNVLQAFSKKQNRELAAAGAPNTPLGLYLDVDFEVVKALHVVDQKYLSQLQQGKITESELQTMIQEHNNISIEYDIELRALKTLTPVGTAAAVQG